VVKEKGYIENDINGIRPERKHRYNTKKKKWEFYNDKTVQHIPLVISTIALPLSVITVVVTSSISLVLESRESGRDYDLTSAYPTGMSRIGTPLWDQFRISTDIDELVENEFSFAMVDFKHPDTVRFPVFPVNEGGVASPKRV